MLHRFATAATSITSSCLAHRRYQPRKKCRRHQWMLPAVLRSLQQCMYPTALRSLLEEVSVPNPGAASEGSRRVFAEFFRQLRIEVYRERP